MNGRIAETLESLEDKIESIKWLITTSSYFRRSGVSEIINTIRRSAGILGKGFSKGTAFENKARKEWNSNILKRRS